MTGRRRLNAAERAQSEALANAVRDRRLAALALCGRCLHAEGWHTGAGCRAFKCTCKRFVAEGEQHNGEGE